MTRQQQLIKMLFESLLVEPTRAEFATFCTAYGVTPITDDELANIRDRYDESKTQVQPGFDPTRLLLQALDTFLEHCDENNVDYINSSFLRRILAVYDNDGVFSQPVEAPPHDNT